MRCIYTKCHSVLVIMSAVLQRSIRKIFQLRLPQAGSLPARWGQGYVSILPGALAAGEKTYRIYVNRTKALHSWLTRDSELGVPRYGSSYRLACSCLLQGGTLVSGNFISKHGE